MNLLNYLEFLGPLQENFTRIYSTASGVITVLIVLWCLNFIIGLIQEAYATGKAFGGFYRNYLHKYLKVIFKRLQFILPFKSSESEPASLGNDRCTTRQAT